MNTTFYCVVVNELEIARAAHEEFDILAAQQLQISRVAGDPAAFEQVKALA